MKKTDAVHVHRKEEGLPHRRGGCRRVDDGKAIVIKCRWHKDEITVPLSEVSGMNVKRERAYASADLKA